MPSHDDPVLAVDVGTSVLKAGLVDATGGLVRVAQRKVGAVVQGEGRHEVDARDWLHALHAAVAELRLQTLSAVVVTGHGPSLVPTDRSGTPVANVMTWLDQRASSQVEQIVRHGVGQREAAFFLAKVLWYRQQAADTYAATHAFVSAPEFVELQLTGHWHTALAAPGFQRYYWDDDLLAAVGVSPEKLPPFIATGEHVGDVTPEATENIGVPAGVPVFAGSTDFVMALLGSGVVESGISLDRAGSSDGLNHCSDAPVEDNRLITLPHIVEGLHTVSGLLSTTGAALDWWQRAGGRSSWDDALAGDAGADGVLFVPHLAGARTPFWRTDVRGAFVGLGLETGPRQLARAVLESVGYALRDAATIMEENGCTLTEIRVTGGHPDAPGLSQLKADILGVPLRPVASEAGLVGCACVAYHGNGTFASLAQAAASLVRLHPSIEPTAGTSARYEERFAEYRSAQQLVADWRQSLRGSAR